MTKKSAIDLLYEAADIAGFDAAGGWPGELEWWQFYSLMLGHRWLPPLREPQPVTLEHPDGRIEQMGYTPDLRMFDTPEAAQRRRASAILGRIMNDAGLDTEERTTTIPQPAKMVLSLGLKRIVPKEQPPVTERRYVVTKTSARDCLKSIKKKPPEHVHAWLEAVPAENPKRQKLRAMLERIKGLDPASMPGETIDFHALAIAYNKDFSIATTTFSGYLDKPTCLPKVCSFKQGAGRNPDYYRSICNQVGVTVAAYDRALKSLETQKASAKAKKKDRGS